VRSARGTDTPARPAKQQSPTWLPIAGAVAVVLVVVAIGWYFATRPTGSNVVDASLAGTQQTDEGRDHVTEGSPIQYKNNPPTSGPHYPAPANWGPYTTPLQNGYWVHNLEHGGVALLYDCPSGCPDVVQIGNQAWSQFPKDKFGEVKLVVTPYSGLPNNAKVAAVAWDWVKLFNDNGDFNLNNFKAFYDEHVDRGPEDIP
jgi:hypothetical protein